MTEKPESYGSRRTYEWPRPALTVDVAVFTVEGSLDRMRLQVLLIERDLEPFQGAWALPGGFVHENEDLPAAASRELLEETGVGGVFLEQVMAVGTPGRDPRGHTVTVVHVALIRSERHALTASGDSRRARWFDVESLPKLAFDHAKLLDLALGHLRRRLSRSPILFELLPPAFALSEMQSLCEAILGRALDRRNFRRKVLDAGFLAPVKNARREGQHRPAQLYKLVPKAFAAYAGKSWALPFH